MTVTATPASIAQKASAKPVTFPALKPADRSCANHSAQALVRVVKGSTDLLLDGHAFAKAELALLTQGWSVVEDIREAVLNPPKTAFDTSDH